MPSYINLKVKEVVKETPDAVTISFKQPLFKKVKYKSGQFLTLVLNIDGKSVSRSYSMSSTPTLDSLVSITVKRVEGGLVSNYLNTQVKPGDTIKVMEPVGNFTFEADKNNNRHIVLFGAGSGVTPLMSILKNVLFFEPNSIVSLVYGNRNEQSIIFKQKLEELKSKFGERFNLVYSLSQPQNQWEGYKGRIDEAVCLNVLNLLPKHEATEYYICGPDGMMEQVKAGLKKAKVAAKNIHMESFTASNESEEALAKLGDMGDKSVKIIIQGDEYQITVPAKKSILDVGLDEGLDMPFSCQSGLCTACMGKCTSGEVKMTDNDSLSADDVAAGYVLTCVGHPASDNVVIEFD